jgi:hypothetical protein
MAVIAQEKNWLTLGKSVATIDNKNPAMLELDRADRGPQAAVGRWRPGNCCGQPVGDVDPADRQERLGAAWSATKSTRKWPFLLGKDTNAFRDTSAGFGKGRQ